MYSLRMEVSIVSVDSCCFHTVKKHGALAKSSKIADPLTKLNKNDEHTINCTYLLSLWFQKKLHTSSRLLAM
ncbi:hypothetical protein CFP56_017043 [Quercus suber]|uniref:Uncharacterized protein n=1 Tax=Quercus suber TaxID=58331 RepID=A0AAW0M3W6_QUESU